MASVDTRWGQPFFDTNVLFSGLYNPRGVPAELLRLQAQQRFVMLVSRQVLKELHDNILAKRPDLWPFLRSWLNDSPPIEVEAPDEDEIAAARRFINVADAPILAAALKSGADCLVSGNTRHFTLEVGRLAGIPILTPSEYLATLQSER
ncbi:MAG: PIN domain-containing protein [Chloroflexi bacterium]|nr:PIN domain-containing protein [Chloroflexota bacterium]